MSCCTVDGTQKFFNESAGSYARKFRRRGIDVTQQLIVRSLESLGLDSRTVLEVGCGVGGLLLSLVRKGAASAIGVEVSEGMVAQAKELASEMGLSGRVRYVAGDFARSNGSIPHSDIVVLDKVLCCYTDPGLLTGQSAAKCGKWLVVSYPRDSVIPRLSFKSMALLGRVLGWSFFPIYHEPSSLDAMIVAHGFREVAHAKTMIWQIKIFERDEERNRIPG